MNVQMEGLCNGEEGAQEPQDPADSAEEVAPFFWSSLTKIFPLLSKGLDFFF